MRTHDEQTGVNCNNDYLARTISSRGGRRLSSNRLPQSGQARSPAVIDLESTQIAMLKVFDLLNTATPLPTQQPCMSRKMA